VAPAFGFAGRGHVMPVCLFVGGKAMLVAAAGFTLSWTHSVEKVRWEEDWTLGRGGLLTLVEARVQGSGAGMEIPDGAILKDGAWHYAPSLPPRTSIVLANSGATGGGWRICGDGRCAEVGEAAGKPAEISACREGGSASAAQ